MRTETDMRNILLQMVYDEGSQKATANALGISPAYLGDILSERRNVSNELANKLGYRRVIGFEPEENKS